MRRTLGSATLVHAGGGELLLRLRGKTVARVDTKTFEVRR
jgi:hypothetical protein